MTIQTKEKKNNCDISKKNCDDKNDEGEEDSEKDDVKKNGEK